MYHYDFEKINDRINLSMLVGCLLIGSTAPDDGYWYWHWYWWSNRRREHTLVKLDMVLINAEWSMAFAHTTSILCVTFVMPDHVPICVTVRWQLAKAKIFRLENHLMHVPEVQEFWQLIVGPEGTAISPPPRPSLVLNSEDCAQLYGNGREEKETRNYWFSIIKLCLITSMQ